MELRHLRALVAVADERHFGRAARKLHISQPPLSYQIKQLEREVGGQLFSRTTHGVTLTHVGRTFLDEARKVLSQSDRAMAEVQRAMRGESGSVSVGFVVPLINGVLPPILQLFHERFPGAQVVLSECSTPSGLTALSAAELDVALVFAPLDDYASAETIFRDSWMVALPSRHRLVARKVVRREDLREESILMVPRRVRPVLFDRTISWFNEGKITPHIVQEIPTIHGLLGLVACGVGVCFLPRSCQGLRCDGVVYRALADQPPPLEVAIAWRSDSTSPLVSGFLSAARDAAAKLNVDAG
jgi:DNA-binding transcriptional LysR family regulator